MRYGVIDIGSNSVRLMLSENGRSVFKALKTTRLAHNIKDGFLDEKSSLNTLNAVLEFVEQAKNYGADKIFAFATAAVRNSANGKDFVLKIYEKCGVMTDVLSGKTEAEIASFGALNGNDGAVIDIGGGSTEISVVKNGNFIYTKSLPMGAVVLTDRFGEDSANMRDYVKNTVKDYGEIPQADFYCIGGTCTSLAAICLKLALYDPQAIDGYRLTASEINRMSRQFAMMNVYERRTLIGLQPERADIIHAGAIILSEICSYTGAQFFTVRESDNLEGYLSYVTGKR